MADFEGAMQVAAARACGARHIVTKNVKDYHRGGLVQRFGTSRLVDRSGIEQLDRDGEPRRLRQACVGGQEWAADNLRQGDIRRIVRGEVGTP